MGILVSWITSVWSTSDQLTDDSHDSPSPPDLPSSPSQIPTLSPDSISGYISPIPASSPPDNVALADKQAIQAPILTNNSSVRSTPNSSIPPHLASFKFIPLLEVPTDSETPSSDEPLYPSNTPVSVLKSTPDNRQNLFVSSDVRRPGGMTSPLGSNSSIPQHIDPALASSSTTPSSLPGLRIDVAAANDPAMDREIEMADANFIAPSLVPDPSTDLFYDEGLSALEKIYLFARSNQSFHRYVLEK